MTTLRILIARAATILLALTLAACGGKGSPADPPVDLTAVAGDGQVTLSWTPGLASNTGSSTRPTRR